MLFLPITIIILLINRFHVLIWISLALMVFHIPIPFHLAFAFPSNPVRTGLIQFFVLSVGPRAYPEINGTHSTRWKPIQV